MAQRMMIISETYIAKIAKTSSIVVPVGFSCNFRWKMQGFVIGSSIQSGMGYGKGRTLAGNFSPTNLFEISTINGAWNVYYTP